MLNIDLDSNFKNFITKNSLEMAIFIEFSLPYYLILNSGFYDFVAPKDFIISDTNKERKIAFQLISYRHEKQEVPLREATFLVHPNDFSTRGYRYDVFNTSISILIESFTSEKEMIISELKNQGREMMIQIMQACIEFILFKYNETTNGVHAISPSVYDCSHLSIYYLYSNLIIEYFCVTPNLSTLSQISDESFKKALKEDLSVWKVFLSESKYACKTFDFKKSIIYSAVALETYISSFIVAKVANPNNFERDSNGDFYSIMKKIKNLVKQGYIEPQITMDKLKENIKKVTYPRNDLMHGKIDNLTKLKAKAEESISSLEIILEAINAY